MGSPECIFCKIVAGELPATIVGEDERTIAFLDILGVESEDLLAVALASRRLAGRAKERLHADGVNLLNSCGAAAWQTVFHFHVHVIPRYEGDPLRLPWLPAPGDPREIAAAAQE